MLDNIRYINHQNEIIEFDRKTLIISNSDLLDFSWDTEKSNETITGFKRKIVSKNVTVVIKTENEEENALLKNRLFEVMEKDVLAQKKGMFVVGDYYLKCYVIGSVKKDYIKRSNCITVKLKIKTDYKFWCREVTKSFLKGNESVEKSAEEFLRYPHSYPYRYSMPHDAGFIQNDHYAACDFKIIVYGPCTNPAIRINGHLYEVITTLYAGEYLLIDSRDNTVFRCMNDGRTENKFNWRNKDSGLFEKISNGRCSVLWNTEAFGFDITLFQERSEPKWSL